MLRASLFGLSMASMASVATAHPAGAAHIHPVDMKPSPRVARRAALLNSYRLNTASSFTILDVPLKGRDMDESARLSGENDVHLYVLAATSKLQETAANATYRLIDDHFLGSNGVGHVRFQQVLDGIDVDTAYFNVNVSSSFSLQACPNVAGQSLIILMQGPRGWNRTVFRRLIRQKCGFW